MTTSQKPHAKLQDYILSIVLVAAGAVLTALVEPGSEFTGQIRSCIAAAVMFVTVLCITYAIDVRVETIENATLETRELWYFWLVAGVLMLLALVLLVVSNLGFLSIIGLGVPTTTVQTAKFGAGLCLMMVGMLWPAVCTLQAKRS
jgi:hypothetical protein